MILGGDREHPGRYGRARLTPRFWRLFLLSAWCSWRCCYVPVHGDALERLRDRRRILQSFAPGLPAVIVASVAATGLLLSLLFPAIAVDAPGASIRNAVADLWGKVWRIFCSGLLAVLPIAVAARSWA